MEALVRQSYWESTGKHQKEYDALYDELVPSTGAAETLHGELLRSATRLFYEYCNNGNCNACNYQVGGCKCESCNGDGEDEDGDECIYCDGSGREEGDTNVSPLYQGFLDFIAKNVPNSDVAARAVESIISADLYSSSTQFSDENMACYDAMMDLVVEYVINNQNKPLSK